MDNDITPSVKDELAIIVSRFNESITDGLLKGALSRAEQLGYPAEKIQIFKVPGAIEIPLIAKKLAQQDRYLAIVCLGAVIRGETSHYNYVCEQVSQGCQQVMLTYEIPVVFGVLTTENSKQAFDRIGGAHGHKGEDAVDVAIEMIGLLHDL